VRVYNAFEDSGAVLPKEEWAQIERLQEARRTRETSAMDKFEKPDLRTEEQKEGEEKQKAKEQDLRDRGYTYNAFTNEWESPQGGN